MADKELDQLENVMLSFAFADNFDKLQKAISTFLSPVLYLLGSSYPATKKKVMEVLSHISKRIKSDKNIILPMDKLVNIYLNTEASNLQKNFTLVYIQLGFTRCDDKKQKELLNILLTDLHLKSEPIQDILLSLLLYSITNLSFPRAFDKDSPNFLPFFANLETKKIILEFFLDILLSSFDSYSISPEITPKTTLGMSERSLKRINSASAPKTYQELNKQKLAILSILENHVAKSELLLHCIVSISNPFSAISQQGDNMFKIALKHIDLEDKSLMKKLYNFYEGSGSGSFKRLAPPMDVKIKIIGILQRSKIATNMFPSTLKVIFDCANAKNSTIKSQQLSIDFAKWVLICGEDKQIRVMGPAILSGLFKMIRNLNYASNQELLTLRSSAYATIPYVCKRLPNLFSEHFDLVEELFNNLNGSSNINEQIPISETLNAIANTLSNLSSDNKEKLYKKLSMCQSSISEITRYVGLYYATHVLPFNDIHGRYTCFLSIIELKTATKDLALRGLQPYKLQKNDMIPDNSIDYPDFLKLVSYININYNNLCKEKNTLQHSIPYDSRVYGQILLFLQETLDYCIKNQNFNISNDISEYIILIDHAFNALKLLDLHKIAANTLTQLFTLIPNTIKIYTTKLDNLWPFLFKGKPETREALAKAISMIIEYLPLDKLYSLLTKSINDLNSSSTIKEFEQIHGSLTVLGMIGSRCIAKNINFSSLTDKNIIKEILIILYNYLSHKNIKLISSACLGIGSIARYNGIIPFLNNDNSSSITIDNIIDKLIEHLKHVNNQIVERVLNTLSDICLGDSKFDDKIISSIFTLSKCKREDILFTSGEALACIGSKWNSLIAKERLLPNEKILDNQLEYSNKPMEYILTKIIKEYVLSSHPDEQEAGSIWLLSLIQYSGKHPQIQIHIQSIQRGFTYMLSSPNEVIQEVGSRGLVLVYEHGTPQSKKQLVSSLVNTLSSGGKSQIKHSNQSELFPEGMLGKTPGDKSKLTTYKELSSLASELGKPELMYKFMNLASHHQLWSSRKGAAFAASTLASSEAKEQLSEYLPTLIPKLYRCSYDPNSRIAQAMNNVLKALLSENKSLDPYWDGIVNELMEGMGSRQWRVRQACCTALADALSGRSFEQLTKHLEKIYYMLFRVIDDIKESVALEALKCSKTLTRISIQICDPLYTSEKDAKPALAISLQFLLEKGLISESKPVQLYALDSIYKMCKAAQHLVAPHVPILTHVLIENLSFFEPKEFTYIQQKTEEYGITKDQLESARLAFSNSMPMNDTLDICAKYITKDNVRDVCSKLFSLLSNGVGLPTQAGTAKFLMNITRQHPLLVKKYSGRLMVKLASKLCDPSSNLRKLYASTIAQLANHCSKKSFTEFMKKLQEYYFSTSTATNAIQNYRNAVGVCLLELGTKTATRLSEFRIDCIPLAFFGTCDTSNEDTKKLFNTVWIEIGGNSAERIFLDEILDLVNKGMNSSSWIMKQQSFLVLKKLGDKVGNALSRYTIQLLSSLLLQLKERRIWTGKEDIFPAISSICKACKDTIEESDLKSDNNLSLTPQDIITTILSECQRTSLSSKEYQRRALTSMVQLFDTFCPPLDMFSIIFPYVQEIIESISKSNINSFISTRMDTKKREEEEKEASLQKIRNNLVQAECLRILGSAWPIQYNTQVIYIPKMMDLFIGELKLANWNTKIKILSAIDKFIERIYNPKIIEEDKTKNSLLTKDITQTLLQAIEPSINDPKYNVVREAGLKTLKELLIQLEKTSHKSSHIDYILNILKQRELDTQTKLQINEIKLLLDKLK